MSFGALQRAFSKRCVRLVIEGNEVQAKEDLREYVEYLRSKEPLIEQFYIYENFYHHTEGDQHLAIMFIKETLAQLASLSRGDVLTFNTLLKNKFELVEIETTELDESIALLIESTLADFDFNTAKTALAFKVLLEHIQSDKPSAKPLEALTKKYNQFADAGLEFFTPQRVVRLGVEKFNTEFGPLFTEAERSLFQKLHAADTHESLTELYDDELALLQTALTDFKANQRDLDDSITNNLDLAEQKLAKEVTVDNLLNIVELRTQIEVHGEDNETN